MRRSTLALSKLHVRGSDSWLNPKYCFLKRRYSSFVQYIDFNLEGLCESDSGLPNDLVRGQLISLFIRQSYSPPCSVQKSSMCGPIFWRKSWSHTRFTFTYACVTNFFVKCKGRSFASLKTCCQNFFMCFYIVLTSKCSEDITCCQAFSCRMVDNSHDRRETKNKAW